MNIEYKIKVLWFSNCLLSESDITSTGTWIQSMAEGLMSLNRIELAVITFANVSRFTRKDFREVKQWLVPIRERLGENGLPAKRLVKEIIQICTEFKPDLVHIWGVESFWGLLTARKYLRVPALLEMQGMKMACAKHMTADMTVNELLSCIGIKEIIKFKTIVLQKNDYVRWGKYEKEIISGHCYIDVQSEWTSAYVIASQPKAKQYYVDLVLRKSFYAAIPWNDFENERNHNQRSTYIFISSSGATTYKGLHVAFRALAELKKEFPVIRLRIAGNINKKGLYQDGYVRWIKHMSRKLNIEDSIDWLGSLNADQIINELQHCQVNLVCSFVESYCLALAEPMYLGVPCVSSFNGGTSWIGKDEETVLFFQPGDSVMCAHKISRILRESQLACYLSKNARELGLRRHNPKTIIERQMFIYNEIIKDKI